MDILGMNCINVDKNSNYLIFQERIGLDQILWGLFKSGQNLHSTKTPLTWTICAKLIICAKRGLDGVKKG